MTRKEAERDEAIGRLRERIKPGDTVYTVLRHVSRSGMSRVIDVQLIEENAPYWIGRSVADALGERFDERRGGGVRVGGCGMDMGFHLVYNLSYALFPRGFECIGKDCPSNDHSNGDRNYEPHHHSDGGYALRHRWI